MIKYRLKSQNHFSCLVISIMTMMTSICLTQAHAQVNVEQSRPQAKEGVSTSLDGSMTMIRGNVSLTQTGLTTRFNYVKGIHTPFIQLSVNYGEKDGVTFLNQSFVHTRWTAMWHRWLGTEFFAQLQEDSFRSLVLRQLYGGGFRSHLLETKTGFLAFGLGAMYEREVYKENRPNQMAASPNLINIVENNLRLTQYLSAKKTLNWSTQLILSCTVYYQPRVDQVNDYRVLADFGVEIKLSEYLRLVESLGLMYDSTPPNDVQRTDLKSISSLRLIF